MTDEVDVAEVEGWAARLAEVHARIAPRFARSEPRERVLAYVRGLLAPLERKNSWTLAEEAGEAIPDGMQRLLAYADWDADAVRDDVRDYVVEHLAPGPGDPAGVLVVDETGFLKKGTKSAGVARMYSGTAGRIENCQIGVFLGYTTAAGRTFVDRELYLPKVWTDDPQRRAEARIDDEVEFATKPELAMRMIGRALDAGVPADWVTGDEVYGQHGGLRRMLEERRMPYVLVVPTSQRVIAIINDNGVSKVAELRADELAARLPAQAWKKICAGNGAKGLRLYHWARAAIRPLEDTDSYWLLVRRSLSDPTDLAYYLCYGPERTPLRELVRVAGARWAIEETFQTAKGQVGLDQYQVRRYDSWYRHITLAMLAHAFLTITAAQTNTAEGAKGGLPDRPRN
ncbi:transposase [Nostocoides japonicum T1-X7]|uniref:Transposase n=1 Tax=Nostocoides japonicum T1-X7 TaxID=1194083 RepID=A0A077M269_9MICO|nr:transposase [Tetrasphaera japonica T1-X7]